MASNTKDSQENDPEAGEPTPDQLKEKGNACVKEKKFEEAVLHYSHAIKLSPKDPILYSNRSLAFLKINQLYYAHEDAEKAIELDENWAKGYFRKAEVLFAAGQYDTSLLSYAAALQRMPNDMNIIDAARKAAQYSNRETMYDKRVPWVGAGIGIVLGVIIVILDQLVTKVPTVSHPALMVFLVMIISGVFWGIAKAYRFYSKDQKKGLLDPPLELLEGFWKDKNDQDNQDEPSKPPRNRYTKAQARQRFKKGKT
uniref:CSON015246 protein n=1 Tax=Culicoides sonorensis TaxID=179676 RepID=A0A336KDY4_CULSO